MSWQDDHMDGFPEVDEEEVFSLQIVDGKVKIVGWEPKEETE